MDYSSWLTSIRDIIQNDDTPLKVKNGRWRVADRISLWENIGSRTLDVQLDDFRKCAVAVFSELNPKFDLPLEQRFAAKIHGKSFKFSDDLRQGLSETLALLGCRGEALTKCSTSKPETIATLVVREVLDNADWRTWASLDNLLPTFAEAAPSEFLRAVESALLKKPCPFEEGFSQEGDMFSGGSHITGLIWALECLAWSKLYFMQGAIALAELALIDPESKWANRPKNSLTSIFLPWLPQTHASIEKRVISLKSIRNEYPTVAWNLILSLLPGKHQSSTGTYKPRWRNPVQDDWQPIISNKDYFTQVKAYAEIAIEMALEDISRIRELVQNFDSLPEESFHALLNGLATSEFSDLPEEDRHPIWTALVDFSAKHRRFPDAEWALPEEVIIQIENLAQTLAPRSIKGQSRRLFVKSEFQLYEADGDWETQSAKIESSRNTAIKGILESEGLKGVLEFLYDVESPEKVGYSLGSFKNKNIDEELIPNFLHNKPQPFNNFIENFVYARYRFFGDSWIDDLNTTNWKQEDKLRFLTLLPFEESTWLKAELWLGHDELDYWRSVRINPYQTDSDLSFAVDRFLEVSRPQLAVECLSVSLTRKVSINSEKVVKALLASALEHGESGSLDYYQIQQLIKKLQSDPSISSDCVASVEWAYLSLLSETDGVRPKFLEKSLSNEPEFFCKIIDLIYRSKHDETKNSNPSEQKKAAALNGWRLLQQWKTPPGMSENGEFSTKQFKFWLTSVKAHTKDSGHLEVAMLKVGEVLFYSPADPSGLWIIKTVASALNSRDAEEMRRGFCSEVFNSRGAHWVDPSGSPERLLAEQWRNRANALEDEGYVRFSASLRELADSYQRDAVRVVESHRNEE